MDEHEWIASKRPNRLIVPLDGSRAADRVAYAVCSLSGALSLPVTVIHVFATIKDLRACAADDIEWSDSADPRCQIKPPSFLRQAVDEIEQAGVSVDTVGRVGSPPKEILKELDSHPGAWLIVSTLGMSGVKRLLIGSTSKELIKNSSSPVLLIPSGLTDEELTKRGEPDRVAVLLDGTAESEFAIPPALVLAKGLSGKLDLVRLEDPGGIANASLDSSGLEQDAAAYLNSLSHSIDTSGIKQNSVVLIGDPEKQVVQYVQREKPDVVALTTREGSGIERWTHASLAEQLVEQLTIPLLLIPIENPV